MDHKNLKFIARQLQAIRPMFPQIQRNFKLAVQHYSLIKPILPEIQQAIQQFQKNLAPILKTIDPVLKQSAQIIKKIKGRKEALLQTGWWPGPSILGIPVGLVYNAVDKYEKGQKNAIDKLFIDFYQEENCVHLRSAVKKWEKNTCFTSWLNVIKDALKAHIEKKYNLSIPVLLLTAEGIATQYCKAKNIFSESMRSKGGKKIKKALEKAQEIGGIEILSLDLLFEVIEKQIFESTEKVKGKAGDYRNFLNRHAVMHGLTSKYGTLENSLRCFTMLDALSLLK